MTKQIEILKRDIRNDTDLTNLLELEELAFRLEDLSGHVRRTTTNDADRDQLLEVVMRSYWSALIIARKAIDKAYDNRKMTTAKARLADQAIERLRAERTRNKALTRQLIRERQLTGGLNPDIHEAIT